MARLSLPNRNSGDEAANPLAATSGAGGMSRKSAARNRPVRPRGEFPERNLRWYHVTAGELRTVSIVQVASALLASVGTFALGLYMDMQKDIAIAQANKEAVPDFFFTVVNFAWWAWILSWALGAAALVWQAINIEGIKAEHGEPPLWARIFGVKRQF